MNRAYTITLAAALLVGCASDPEIYDRPRTTANQFRGDFAGCQAEARAMPQQHTQPGSYVATTTFHNNRATTTVGPNPYEALADALVDGAANADAYAEAVHGCMLSKGYVLRRPKASKVTTFDGRKD